MDIKTKFNIGDVCYKVIDNYNVKSYNIRSIKVFINNTISCKLDITIMYELDNLSTLVNERMLFKNLDEIVDHFKQEINRVEPDKPFYAHHND